MIEVKNLTKNYGTKQAVKGISFSVKDGEILGLLGPNGAGKSTTMNMLTGYISSTSGSAEINGVDILEDPIKAKSYIGYLPEIPPLYVDMTVKAYLNFVYDLKKCKLPRKAHISDICNLCRITDVSDRIMKHLSKGYRQRVGLAQALIGNPPVLILDEPTVGLDPRQILEIRSLIKKLGRNHTVIISSHILSEIQAVCDRIIIINKGVVQADGTTDKLSHAVTGENKIVVRIDAPRTDVLQALREIPEVREVKADMQREGGLYDYEVEAEIGADVRRKVNEIAREKGWDIMMLNLGTMSLEDIFLKITMGENVETAAAKKSEPETEEKPEEKDKTEKAAEKPDEKTKKEDDE